MRSLTPFIATAVVRDGKPAGDYIPPVAEAMASVNSLIDNTGNRFACSCYPSFGKSAATIIWGKGATIRTDTPEKPSPVHAIVLGVTARAKSFLSGTAFVFVTNGVPTQIDVTPQAADFQNTQHATVIDMRPQLHSRSYDFCTDLIPVTHVYNKDFNANTFEAVGFVAKTTRELKNSEWTVIDSIVFNMNRIHIRIPGETSAIVLSPEREVDIDEGIITGGGCNGSLRSMALIDILDAAQYKSLYEALNGEKLVGFPVLPQPFSLEKIKVNICSAN
jgi:hypothetical protein